jgi:hypothetical protein
LEPGRSGLRVQAPHRPIGGGILVGAAALGASPISAWLFAAVATFAAILHTVPSAVLIGTQRWRQATMIGLITGHRPLLHREVSLPTTRRSSVVTCSRSWTTATRTDSAQRSRGSSVLDVDRANAEATLVSGPPGPFFPPADTFDCVLLTQTSQQLVTTFPPRCEAFIACSDAWTGRTGSCGSSLTTAASAAGHHARPAARDRLMQVHLLTALSCGAAGLVPVS